jgi:hypothetical protein
MFLLPRHLIRLLLGLAVACTFSSCAVVMATKQPTKKDLGLLNTGTPRSLLIAEFGAPIHFEQKDGKRVEVFSFQQGYSKAARVTRALGHGAADLFTAGIWEVVGTPTEALFDGKAVVAQVTFDASEMVEQSVMLKNK